MLKLPLAKTIINRLSHNFMIVRNSGEKRDKSPLILGLLSIETFQNAYSRKVVLIPILVLQLLGFLVMERITLYK